MADLDAVAGVPAASMPSIGRGDRLLGEQFGRNGIASASHVLEQFRATFHQAVAHLRPPMASLPSSGRLARARCSESST